MRHPENYIDRLADLIALYLRSHTSFPPSYQSLAKKFKINDGDLERALNTLRAWGYGVKCDHNGRVAFTGAPDTLSSAELSFALKTKLMGRIIHAYRSVQSTNTVASQLAGAGALEGEMVVAETQTRGRGRLGRFWHSPEKLGAYFSLILRPKIAPADAPALSIVAALALAEAIENVTSLTPELKWPNDVFISTTPGGAGKKVAGILTELSAEIDRIHYVVVGVGVNINHRKTDFPSELRDHATSIRIATKAVVSRVEILQAFLRTFEDLYSIFQKRGFPALRKKALARSALIGQVIKLRDSGKPGGALSGRAVDIDEKGRLVVQTAHARLTLSSGEVTLHRD